jgi:hypothetical protein
LSAADGTAKIITIDLNTKRAELMASGSGKITALADRPKGPFWAGMSGALVPIVKGQDLNKKSGQGLEPGVDIGGLILPGQFETPQGWPEAAKDSIMATQSGTDRTATRSSGGFNVVAVPTEFGQPASEMQVVVDGFLTSTKRASWGHPAAMVMDARGLFIADRWSGNLWRLSKATSKPVIIVEPEPEPVKPVLADTQTEVEDESMMGSGIGSGSHISTASRIDHGEGI